MNIYEIIKNGPRYLTIRYGSLNSYVWEHLFPQDYKNRILGKIKNKEEKKEKIIKMKELVDEATVLVFIFVTRQIFTEGSRAAKETVDILKELGVNEFYLGSKKFTKRNENVILGDNLAQELLLSLDDKTQKLILEAKYPYQIINEYKKFKLI